MSEPDASCATRVVNGLPDLSFGTARRVLTHSAGTFAAVQLRLSLNFN